MFAKQVENGETQHEQYQETFDTVLKQNNEMDNVYDLEADHGRIDSVQIIWDERIQMELVKYEEFYESNRLD